eukprot:TRINITY_DN38725_c0_g1_i1.p2 TRINITY_DN38725_c0_g1~~TRINITY_DN38725_c0_g1_i1.p2  ORF type:complete len:164 (+),score=50.13 TRINITY_DN38725_c0_g1_i1:58-492(+)
MVNVADLSLMELKQYSQVLEDEIKSLTQHFSALRAGRERYYGSKTTLEELEGCKAGEKMLVPLTKSLFVPGELANTETAIIEVGAGYYIKMSTQKGKDFMDRKMQSLTGTMSEIEKAVNIKRQQLEVMEMTMQQKAAMMQQQQK